jgi:hypothetical protein
MRKHKRHFFYISILWFLVILNACSPATSVKVKESKVGLGWAKTMVNATIFRRNAIVSFNNYQYISYYDSTGIVVLGKRKLGTSVWTLHQTQHQGNVSDAHNGISITIDGQGFMHMAWDQHGNKLNYCKSLQPERLEMGDKQVMMGSLEDHVTYPQFFKMPSGDLIFVYRDGSSGNGNVVLNKYSIHKKIWTRIQENLISGEGVRNAYWQLHVSKTGSIHLSWVWRETYHVETNHDMCYAVSHDEGRTWRTTGGKEYTLPIIASTAEYAASIEQKSDLINQTSMASDDRGQPYIATYYQNASDSCVQYHLIYYKNSQWRTSKITNRMSDFDLAGAGTRSIPISRPQLIVAKNKLVMIYRDEEHQDRICMASTDVKDLRWTTVELTNYSVDRWEPSYDPELLHHNKLHLYVQKVGQLSGEKATELNPQMVSVLEVSLK